MRPDRHGHPTDHVLLDSAHLARHATTPFDGSRRAVRTWTVDDPAVARHLVALGVDAIITNAPQHLKRSLSSPETS